jgi:dihydroneopterin aldolase/2-amino-4-hydroxy-6-hydroxymethyldihydropteridine diphosphokinase/dihydropteroate synthase
MLNSGGGYFQKYFQKSLKISKNIFKINKKYLSMNSTAYLGLGSNLGNRFFNFQKCVKMIGEKKIGIVEKTSQIYESPCLDENNSIVESENKFLNSVIKIKTNLSPMDLLIKCKEIESEFKRKPKTKYYEAREIDIDILTYNNELIDIEQSKDTPFRLNIPHIHMYDRLFVLKPMMDIDKNLKFFNRQNGNNEGVDIILKNLMKKLKISPASDYDLEKINKFEKIGYLYKTLNVLVNGQEQNLNLSKNSILMGVINCTPDSFSGGLLKKSTPADYEEIIEKLIANKNNIDIIDIGGESTRPGSQEIDPKSELDRIAPLIFKIRNNPELKNKIISIDTRKALVAEESIKLGANIINDVSGGLYDPKIISVARKYSVPFILMHSRATPDKMMKGEFLNYEKGVIQEIINELDQRIKNFKNYNPLSRGKNEIQIDNGNGNSPSLDWNIIIDPGVGFSKNKEQNLEIIRNLDEIKKAFPNILLLGHSKKKFIQDILNVNADNTLVGNIVVTSLGIEKGANIIRVHDFKEIKQTIEITDVLFKK